MHAYHDHDEHGNVVLGTGATILQDSRNTIVSAAKGKMVVVRGLENYIVIDTDDALLIYPMDREQEIKALRKQGNIQDYL